MIILFGIFAIALKMTQMIIYHKNVDASKFARLNSQRAP